MARDAASRVPRAPGPIIAIFMADLINKSRVKNLKKDHGFQ
jgi:hypothetical protein